MTISVGQSIAIIAVCAACTFLERWLPWLLFGRRAVPKVVEYLGKILPMAVMVSLLVYCLRGMQFTSAGAWVPQVIAVGVTAGLHWWRRNTLLSIAAGTVWDTPPMVVNDLVRSAILLIVGHLYANREDVTTGAPVQLPTGARALIAPYRKGMGV